MIKEGSYQELQISGLEFTKLLESSTVTEASHNNGSKMDKPSNNNIARSISYYIRQESVLSNTSSIEETKFSDIIAEPVEVAETRSSGNIPFKVYMSYIFAGGHLCKVICLILICIITQVLASSGDYWITYW